MQTKYDSSSNPYAQSDDSLTPVYEPELPGILKTVSLIGLIAVLLGTAFGSLLASPGPNQTATQEEESEILATDESSTEASSMAFEPSTSVVDPASTTETTGESTASDASSATVTETETTPSTDSTVTITPETETPSVESEPAVIATETPTEAPAATPPESLAVTSAPETTPETETAIAESMPEVETTTSETTTAVDPTPVTPTEPETVASAPPSESLSAEQLENIVYNTIDQAWTTTPVTGESVYTVKVAQDGTLLGFEPKSSVATENVSNTPLPQLVDADTTATPASAAFDVTFQTDGTLGIQLAE